MNITLHIDRVVLDGLPVTRSQGALVQAAIEAELAQLLTEGGLASDLQSGVAVPHVKADAIQPTNNNPRQLGQQIARSVYGGIGQTR